MALRKTLCGHRLKCEMKTFQSETMLQKEKNVKYRKLSNINFNFIFHYYLLTFKNIDKTQMKIGRKKTTQCFLTQFNYKNLKEKNVKEKPADMSKNHLSYVVPIYLYRDRYQQSM